MANYKIVKTDDVPNYSSNGEMRMMRGALDSKQIALTYRMIPAGYKPAHGHSHTKIDEIIFVFTGTLQVKLDDVVQADQMFNTLMGDRVEPRRLFIESHALEVRNLDI